METDLGVLVRCDCCEGRLREGEGLENTPADTEEVVCLHNVEAWVVPMHRVQDDLQTVGRDSSRVLSRTSIIQNPLQSSFKETELMWTALTYMAVLVECVVGELEFEEGDGLLHPVAPQSRRVWVEVRPAGRLRLRFSCHLPFLFIPL